MRALSLVTVAAGLAAATPNLPGSLPSENDLVDRDLASDIWNVIEEVTTCAACQSLLVVLKGLALLGDNLFVSTLSGICKLTNLVDDDVCEGAIKLEGPILAHDLRNLKAGSKTATLLCTNFVGLCDYPDVDEWELSLSEKPDTSRPAPSGQTPVKIVQFSDTHVDPFYTEGANSNCTKPICCRSYTSADAPGANTSPAGPNGDHSCDTPVALEQSMFNAIRQIVPDMQLAIFTGDIVDHAIWNTSKAQNTIDINDMYNRAAASGISPLYGTAGNHEMHPTNAFAPNNVGNDAQWVYSLLSGLWTQSIGTTAADSTKNTGRYSVKFGNTNLRLISLNTNMYYVQNYWLYERDMTKDPNGQLAWLASELQAAETAGERVYIFGHMPMGGKDTFHDGSNAFDTIVNRYDATIAAMFFGHTHRDEFQISYSDYSNRNANTAAAMSYIMPSLTPTDGNPTFRVYTVDPVTWGVLDSVTYMADMDDSGFQTSGPVWKKYYSAKETYGPLVTPAVSANDISVELTPAFWHNVTAAFEANPAAFQGYIARKTRGWNPESCTGDCITSTICQLRAGRAQDNCVEPEPGQNIFRKRGLDQNGHKEHRDECGVSVSRETLTLLMSRKDLRENLMKVTVSAGATFERV